MKQSNKALNRFARILRDHSEKATQARIDTLTALSRERYPLSIKEISQKVKAPDQSTLYRTLEMLAKKGIVKEVSLGQSIKYEIAIGRAHHHHVSCTSCDLVVDVETCPALSPTPLPRNF